MSSPSILIKDPALAFIYDTIYELVNGIDFTVTIEVSQYGMDPAIPQYKVFFNELNQTIGGYPTVDSFLEAVRLWFKNNPIEWEEADTIGANNPSIPPLTKPERLELLKLIDEQPAKETTNDNANTQQPL